MWLISLIDKFSRTLRANSQRSVFQRFSVGSVGRTGLCGFLCHPGYSHRDARGSQKPSENTRRSDGSLEHHDGAMRYGQQFLLAAIGQNRCWGRRGRRGSPSHSLISDYFPVSDSRHGAVHLFSWHSYWVVDRHHSWRLGCGQFGLAHDVFPGGHSRAVGGCLVLLTLREPPRGMSDLKTTQGRSDT